MESLGRFSVSAGFNASSFMPPQLGLSRQILDNIRSTTFNLSPRETIFLIVCVAWALEPLFEKEPAVTSAVYHGYSSWLEPTLFLRARFILNAKALVASGSLKWKDRPFVLRRWDMDLTVFPNKFLDELRHYPASKLSGVHAHIGNMVPKWTYSEFMTQSDLQFRVLLQKVNPSLSKYLDVAQNELDHAWPIDMPQPQEWAVVDVQHALRMSVSRVTARLFLGESACRNREWLNLSVSFSIDFFACAYILRKIPKVLHPIIAPLLPLRWRLAKALRTSTAIVGPLVERHKDVVQRRAAGEKVAEEENLLNWIIDNAEADSTVEQHSHRQAFLTLASIFTTATTVSNLLFDLCAHPDWVVVLRTEIEEIEKDLGRFGERAGIGAEQWLPRLEKMDSALAESLRMSPPLLLVNQRHALVPISLKDGTHIPSGTRIACSKGDIVYNDPAADQFDPMRWYRKRYETGDTDKHLAVMPEKDYMHFGFGRQACPGRHLAVGMVKLMMIKLLSEFEFKFPQGKGRPKTFTADEYCFLDLSAKLMVRKRRIVSGVVEKSDAGSYMGEDPMIGDGDHRDGTGS
ncbi:hypothetical protein HBI81_039170 [Parastagonospora nodorum]|nr:hypothetical protein HBI10_000350 [Parastagonospora nodorum]KAH4016442.1 hypothetical protein HBI13_148380 [Parastagonospora nodorum]KAH4111849.1 hypothetical protein HBH47_234640 [Parastagonospora nodorum]KAH4821667.1 hypothetical protein HBH61_022800 [Parastagonospora nodorum]KAH4971861.1 hypothetical protein HBI78_019430 [Parastagonospora nodorum]